MFAGANHKISKDNTEYLVDLWLHPDEQRYNAINLTEAEVDELIERVFKK